MRVLLDTHTWAWSLDANSKLPRRAVEAIEGAAKVAISVVSIFEIAQKVRLGKWPEMAPLVPLLSKATDWQVAQMANVTPDIAHLAGSLDWPHRDPFDRMIAATALVNGWVLISADTVFDSLIGLRRVW